MSPRTSEQFEAMRSQSRQKILLAALELFAIEGYHTTTISMIAKHAGVSKGLMYNYFAGKESLLRAIMEMFAEQSKEILATGDNLPPKEQLKAIIETTFEFIQKEKEIYRLLMSLAFQPRVFEGVKDYVDELLAQQKAAMVPIFNAIGYEDPETEMMLLGATMDGIALATFNLQEDEYPLEKIKYKLIQQYCE